MLVAPVLHVVYLYVMIELVLLVVYRVTMLAGYSLQMVDAGFRLSANALPYVVPHP